MTDVLIKRRALLTGGAGLLLAGCDRVAQIPAARKILFAGEDMHYGLQRALQDPVSYTHLTLPTIYSV